MVEIKWPEMCSACDEPISDHTVKDLKSCRDGLLDDAGKMLKAFKQLDKIYIKKRQQTLSKKEDKDLEKGK